MVVAPREEIRSCLTAAALITARSIFRSISFRIRILEFSSRPIRAERLLPHVFPDIVYCRISKREVIPV